MGIVELSKLEKRTYSWTALNIQRRKCPLCSIYSRAKYIRPDGLPVEYCKRRGLYFIFNTQTDKSIRGFCNKYYDGYSKKELTKADANLKIERNPLSDFRIRILTKYIDVADKNILDVGCGNGLFIQALERLDGNVSGIDLNEESM